MTVAKDEFHLSTPTGAHGMMGQAPQKQRAETSRTRMVQHRTKEKEAGRTRRNLCGRKGSILRVRGGAREGGGGGGCGRNHD